MHGLLGWVRAQDYVRMLHLTGVPAPAAVRAQVLALRSTLSALCPDAGQDSRQPMAQTGGPEKAAFAEIAQALEDAEAVLCCPQRGRLYALQQQSDGSGDSLYGQDGPSGQNATQASQDVGPAAGRARA